MADQNVQNGNPGGGGAGAPNVAPANNVVAPAVAPVSWVVHPYQVDFNPGTKQGEAIFRNKTKGLASDKRFTLQRKDAQSIRRYFAAKSDSLGSVVTRIPIAFDINANPVEFGNLLTDYGSIPMDTLIRNAHSTFANSIPQGQAMPPAPFQERVLDPSTVVTDQSIFYKRVHSLVVTELIKNSFTEEDYSKLMLRKKDFAFYDLNGYENVDGACLLKAIFDKIDPNVIVGVDLLRQKIEQTKLHQFSNNVDDMLTSIEEAFQKIQENKSTCESIRRYTINALLSGPNDDFNRFIKSIKDDIDSQTGVNKELRFDEIALAARTKYNNMDATGEWKKVNPKDAQILALTTRLDKMERDKAAPAVHATNAPQDGKMVGGSADGRIGGVASWRITKKGDTMTHEGTTWHWCPHHKHPKGVFDGLYCAHSPAEHTQWKTAQKERFGKNKSGSTESAPNAPAAPAGAANKLALGQRLKEVLCTKLMLSDADADAYCNEICQLKD